MKSSHMLALLPAYASWLKRHSSPNLQLPLSLKSKQTPAIMIFRSSSILEHIVCKPKWLLTNPIVTTIRTNMSERPLPLPPFPPLPLLLPPSGQSLASSTMWMHSPEVVDDYEALWSSAHQCPISRPGRSGLLHSWSTRWTCPGNKRTNMNGNGNLHNPLQEQQSLLCKWKHLPMLPKLPRSSDTSNTSNLQPRGMIRLFDYIRSSLSLALAHFVALWAIASNVVASSSSSKLQNDNKLFPNSRVCLSESRRTP